MIIGLLLARAREAIPKRRSSGVMCTKMDFDSRIRLKTEKWHFILESAVSLCY